jgi:hypothetical protein
MKAILVPVYFKSAADPDFVKQLSQLKLLLAEEAEFLAPVALGQPILGGGDSPGGGSPGGGDSPLGGDSPAPDAVIFPDMLGDAFRRLKEFQALPQPVLVVTSEFGTVSMWDWEINSFLGSNGVKVIAPNTLEKTRQVCRALALRKMLKTSKFLVYQDHPASAGLQDEIFKRFYWWEPEAVAALESRYGLQVVKKSFKELGAAAKAISDESAQQVWDGWQAKTPLGKVTSRQVLSAVKLYMKVKEDLDADPAIIASGMNCLNESMYSDTTPCLAWNLLYQDRKLVWGCEGDLVSMLTEVLISKTIAAPFMMTNLYPFVMGQAALKHEHIPNFPEVDGDPQDYILAAHCGYLGVVPQAFSTEWALRDKVLAIVDDNATALDARLPEGPITLVKLAPPFDHWSLIEGRLAKYVQYPGSHCLNGAVLHVSNGPKMIDNLVSHHYIITTGHNQNALEMISKVFDLQCETI